MFCGGFGRFGGYGFGPSGSIGYGWMFLAAGFRLLIFIGLIILAVKLYKKYSNKSNASMRILDEKFAKGEISEEEYLRRKTILSQNN
ncbi:SHOCT domain-containing protein [Candidatus Clostridium stratigraminis]|uniref:SHOCT domain-containing protein n=1 Tax=Candidatus Clostridium stratigraminis TaxID=3381661 RepID=A0ABW8T5J7_9CLOT